MASFTPEEIDFIKCHGNEVSLEDLLWFFLFFLFVVNKKFFTPPATQPYYKSNYSIVTEVLAGFLCISI